MCTNFYNCIAPASLYRYDALFIHLDTTTFFVPERLSSILQHVDASRNDIWLSHCASSNNQVVYVTTRNSLLHAKTSGAMPTCSPLTSPTTTWDAKSWAKTEHHEDKDDTAIEENNVEDKSPHESQDSSQESQESQDSSQDSSQETQETKESSQESTETNDQREEEQSQICEVTELNGFEPIFELSKTSLQSKFANCATITPMVTRHDWLFTWNMVREGADIVHAQDDPLLYNNAPSTTTSRCAVVIAIPSVSKDFSTRQKIRLTWGGRQARYYSIRVIFLIPFENTTPRWLDVTLESEMSLHNDILLVEDKETHLERVRFQMFKV